MGIGNIAPGHIAIVLAGIAFLAWGYSISKKSSGKSKSSNSSEPPAPPKA